MNIRCCFRTVVHSLLINHHKKQVIFLVCIDLIVLLFCYKVRKSYRTFLTFLLSFGYCASFAMFDGLLLSENYFSSESLNYQMSSIILIIMILILALLQTANIIILNILDVLKARYYIKNNQIQPGKTKSQ